jgi:hypothetical protein
MNVNQLSAIRTVVIESSPRARGLNAVARFSRQRPRNPIRIPRKATDQMIRCARTSIGDTCATALK